MENYQPSRLDAGIVNAITRIRRGRAKVARLGALLERMMVCRIAGSASEMSLSGLVGPPVYVRVI